MPGTDQSGPAVCSGMQLHRYLKPAVNRQPGYRWEARRAIEKKRIHWELIHFQTLEKNEKTLEVICSQKFQTLFLKMK